MDALSTQIASRKFERVKHGYDPKAVESWLAKVGDHMAKLEDALRAANSRIDELERLTRDVKDADAVVRTAFLAASDAKAKLIAEAEARARQIVAQAEKRAAELDSGAASTSHDQVESMLSEARTRIEESERFAAARRAEAEREAVEIIQAARERLTEAGSSGRDEEAEEATAELRRLVATLGSLKQAARQGLEQAEQLEADIEAVIGDA